MCLTCAGPQSRRRGWQRGLGGNAQEGHQHPRGGCPRYNSLQKLQGMDLPASAGCILLWLRTKLKESSRAGLQRRGCIAGASG